MGTIIALLIAFTSITITPQVTVATKSISTPSNTSDNYGTTNEGVADDDVLGM